MKMSIDLDAETARQISAASKAVREDQATVIRRALRTGLPLLVNQQRAALPEDAFAADYRKPRRRQLRLEAAAARTATGIDR